MGYYKTLLLDYQTKITTKFYISRVKHILLQMSSILQISTVKYLSLQSRMRCFMFGHSVCNNRQLLMSVKLVPGSWFPIPASLFLLRGSLFLVPGSRFLVPGSWFPVPASSIPLPCSLFPVHCSRFLVIVPWSPFPGSWFPIPSSRVTDSQFPMNICSFNIYLADFIICRQITFICLYHYLSYMMMKYAKPQIVKTRNSEKGTRNCFLEELK